MTCERNTRRLALTLADESDLPALKEIDAECDAYFDFDPSCAQNHSCSLGECLTSGDIPPGVSKQDFVRENYRFYCIRQGGELIGFLSYYLQYQRKDTVYLSVLYIKEACRKNGIGAEILRALARDFLSGGYTTIRLHCSLRNATALRFWVRNGFSRIVCVECDGNLYPENFGGIVLEARTGLVYDTEPSGGQGG